MEWLLASIRRCGPRGGTLRDIVAAGDYINHAIFTREELRSGLAALLKTGEVCEKGGKWMARKGTGKVPSDAEIDAAIRSYTG